MAFETFTRKSRQGGSYRRHAGAPRLSVTKKGSLHINASGVQAMGLERSVDDDGRVQMVFGATRALRELAMRGATPADAHADVSTLVKIAYDGLSGWISHLPFGFARDLNELGIQYGDETYRVPLEERQGGWWGAKFPEDRWPAGQLRRRTGGG